MYLQMYFPKLLLLQKFLGYNLQMSLFFLLQDGT